MIFYLDYSEKACQDDTTLVIFNNSLKAGSPDPIFGSDFYSNLEVTDANQHFYGLKQCQSLFSNVVCICSFHLSNPREIMPHVGDKLCQS